MENIVMSGLRPDELRRVGGEAAGQAGAPDDGQPGQQHALAPEPSDRLPKITSSAAKTRL
jgi:hypothetical protein